MLTAGNTYTSIVSFKSDGTISGSFYSPGGAQNEFTSAYNQHTLFFITSYITD